MIACNRKVSILFFLLLSLAASLDLVIGQTNETTPTSPQGDPSSNGDGGVDVVVTSSTTDSASSGSDFPVCNICGEGRVIGNPDALPIDHEDNDVQTCAELQEIGNNGTINPDLCEEIPDMVEINCGCRVESGSSSAVMLSTKVVAISAIVVLFGSLAN